MPDLRESVALGLLQGPAEVLPVSSSAHVELVPWALGWEHASLDPALRKEMEVALHAGTAVALLWARPQVRPWFALLSVAPAAVAGKLLLSVVEERLGAPPAMAAGLVLGSVALWRADAVHGSREEGSAGPADALALGLAQACALWPGVSRSGATLAAARARGFTPRAARALSREAALPVLVAASALKLRDVARAPRLSVFAGGAAAALSTAAAQAVVRGREGRVPLRVWAAYRVAVAGAVLWVWQDRSR